jgi:tetratricopeptide (TPR) repeat protein
MLEDRYGLALSTSSMDARDAYVEGIDRMLAADGHVEDILGQAILADPDFALAHAAIGRQHHLMARGKEGRASLETATQLAASATSREQQHVEILSNIISGQVPKSFELTKEHLADHPRDAFVLAPACGVFGTIGFSGRLDREAEMISFLEPFAADYGDDWWFQTVYGFALLETGRWERGRDLARQSLEQRPSNAHAAHTLAHALYEGGADEEALAFMSEWIPGADGAGMLHCHIFWHYALLQLIDGQSDAAVHTVETNCFPGTTPSPSINVFSDATSFLWRAEIAGLPRRTEHWATIRDYYEENFRRPIVFVDAHAGLPYAALGENEKLTACISQLQELGEAGRLPAGTTAATLTRSYEAFANEQWSTVIDVLEPTMDQVVRIGGSRAQRDLITNTLLAAYINDGRTDAARALVDAEHDRQPSHPVAGLVAG